MLSFVLRIFWPQFDISTIFKEFMIHHGISLLDRIKRESNDDNLRGQNNNNLSQDNMVKYHDYIP